MAGKPHNHHHHAKIEDALARIEESSFRLTRPRRVLLETIFSQPGSFTINDLQKALSRKSKDNGCDMVTIYRTLPVFEELGLIGKCDFTSDPVHYEVVLHLEGHHHHFVCTSCHQIEPLEFCVVDSQEMYLKKNGYTNLSHRLEFSGLCPDCSKKS